MHETLGGARCFNLRSWRTQRLYCKNNNVRLNGQTSSRMAKSKPEFETLRKDAQALVAYWREALVESQRADVQTRANAIIEVPPADIARGRCSPTLYIDLRKLFDDRRVKGRGPNGGEMGRDEPLPVLLCPLALISKGSGAGRGVVELLWLPGQLTATGRLLPPRALQPWIPRALLQPQVDDELPSVGSDAKLTAYVLKHGANEWSDWDAYWSYVDRMFLDVAGAPLSAFECEGYQRRRNGIAAPDRSATGGLRALIELYDRVLAGSQHPGLIPQFALRRPMESKVFRETKAWVSRMAVKHCGQFGNGFALAPSQRRAVHRALALKHGEFLCVTGPPGTGKTTMLQSVVASLWIGATQDEYSLPPIIVATGATNQAVTNVISAMERSSADDDSILGARWLPRVHSYGTFCVSASKAQFEDEIQRFQVELLRGESFSREMEEAEYVRAAEAHYLEQAEKLFGTRLSLPAAVGRLKQAIAKERGKLYRAVITARDGSFREWLERLCFLRPRRSLEEFFAALAPLDPATRHKLFLLAGRYWEGRWLMEMERVLSLRYAGARADEQERLRTEEQDWRRRAMITPLFVSTLAMLPRFFSNRRERERPPIDLLIFDEASQVTPEIGVACMGLAARALVVGDDQQLEPVWGIPTHADRVNAKDHGLLGRDEERGWQDLIRMGVPASQGSLMRLALRCSRHNDGASTIGVFLSEQRRSVPGLVAICNSLAYGDRLRPMRQSVHDHFLPPLGYLHVDGRNERVGTSRCNRKEADAVCAWLAAHRPKLLTYYDAKDLEEVVAVISPFAAQAEMLRERLGRTFTDRLLVGTVNALQGAERPVVLFSAVYDPSFSGEYFFDRGVNMLNVAVSRARDSFIVVGNTQIFGAREGKPSWVLGRFMFADPGAELNVDGASADSAPKSIADEHRWLATLEEHRQVLKDAFFEASTEVLIVSPTISSIAIGVDRIAELINNARARGVRVVVYTDCSLDLDGDALKARAAEGRQLLLDAGAELKVVNGIHNKALGIDGQVFVDGSFNWLSANRRVGGRHQKHETSNLFRGTEAARRIALLKEEMAYRGFVNQDGLLRAALSRVTEGS